MHRQQVGLAAGVAEKIGFATAAFVYVFPFFALGPVGLTHYRLDVFGVFALQPAAALVGLLYVRRDRWADKLARPLCAALGVSGLVALYWIPAATWVAAYDAAGAAFVVAAIAASARIFFPGPHDAEVPISRLDAGLEPAASAQQEIIARALRG